MTSGNAEKVTLSYRGGDLVIVRRWFEEGRTLPATVWVVAFNAFIGFLFFKLSAPVATRKGVYSSVRVALARGHH